jgi:hypothetical protein
MPMYNLRMAQGRCQARLQQSNTAAHQRRLGDAAINLRHDIHRRGLSGVACASSEFFCLRLLGTTPNEVMGTTVSVLLRSKGIGEEKCAVNRYREVRLAICSAGGRASDGNPWLSSPGQQQWFDARYRRNRRICQVP